MAHIARYIVVIIVLATGASAFWYGPKKEVDFDAFNEYLVAKQPKDDDPKSNLALIKSNVDQLRAPLKRTAQMIIRLASEADQCSPDLVSTLATINTENVNLDGNRRVEKLLRAYLVQASSLCVKFIEQQVEALHEKLASKEDESIKLFIDKQVVELREKLASEDRSIQFSLDFTANSVWDNDQYLAISMYKRALNKDFFKGRELLAYLKKVARDDPATNFNAIDEISGKASLDKQKSDATYALDKYVARPCGQLTSNFRDLFEAAKVGPQFNNDVREYAQSRGPIFKRLMWTYNFCAIIMRNYDHYKQELLGAVAKHVEYLNMN